jgi:hypothetical protein
LAASLNKIDINSDIFIVFLSIIYYVKLILIKYDNQIYLEQLIEYLHNIFLTIPVSITIVQAFRLINKDIMAKETLFVLIFPIILKFSIILFKET